MCKFDIVEVLQKLIIAIFVTILSTTVTMKFFDLIIYILTGHRGHRRAHRHDSGVSDLNKNSPVSRDE